MFLVTSVVAVDLTTFLYNPFEHHHEVNLVAATSKLLTLNLPLTTGGPPVASVTEVVKIGQEYYTFSVAAPTVYDGLTVPICVTNAVLLLQQAPPSAAAVEYHVDSSVVGTS